MYLWIPALNVLDSLLYSLLDRNSAYICVSDKSIVVPEAPLEIVVPSEIETSRAISMLKTIVLFTSKLLESSANKDIYNSIEVIINYWFKVNKTYTT